MKIAFIGFGNMAKAIATPLQANPQYVLWAAAPSLPVAYVEQGVSTHPDNLAVLERADIVILAVKPAQMHAVLTQIRDAIPAQALVVSVAAGITVAWLTKHCRKAQAIVRCMPNIAVAVAQGATPLIANQHVQAVQKHDIETLFRHMGIVTWVNDENDIDRLTALSGSGPAYVFLFLEALIHGAQALGLDYATARTFALQTLRGAHDLAYQQVMAIDLLREQVTSKKGTTAAALDILEKADFQSAVQAAMQAAFTRAQELSTMVSQDEVSR